MTLAGAVYRPDELIVPPPDTDQVTAVLAAFVTVAENCCVWPAYRLAVVGDTLTVTAPRVPVHPVIANGEFPLMLILSAATVMQPVLEAVPLITSVSLLKYIAPFNLVIEPELIWS